MGITRRGFLALLGSGVIGAGLDVDRLLWAPGAKTIFLPPALKLYTTDQIVKEALAILSEQLTVARLFDRTYAGGPFTGKTVRVPLVRVGLHC